MPRKHYRVGYKSPPPEYRFRKGQSGNPQGRPKQVVTTDIQLILEVLDEAIIVACDGERVRIPLRMQIERNLVDACLKGDLKAGRVLEKYRKFGWSFGVTPAPRIYRRDF